MSRIYEIMYLIDNDLVRAGWSQAKATASALVEKHGGHVLTARRWDERKLAYPIHRRRRGTYLLAHAELEPTGIVGLRRELDLAEHVLRYLILQVETVPEEERALTEAESAAGFSVPPPPEEAVHGADEAEEPDTDEEAEEASEGAVPAGELAREEV